MYAIRRRSGWTTLESLQEAAARSSRFGYEEMAGEVRWIRSYIIDEDDGSLGMLCIFQATDTAALREHAHRADMPADEIHAVADTVIVRPDPVAVAA